MVSDDRAESPLNGGCVLEQVTAVWQTMDTRRRFIVLAATVVVFAAVLVLSNMASKPSMSLLYAGLENQQSGDIVTALEQRGVTYDVRGDSIYVEATRRDELRMTLAAEGLPAIGGAGYELLDSMSGFGTTSQMFDAAYWRAKEGELARTIVANPSVRSARVHLAVSSDNAFRRSAKSTASVFVTGSGGAINAQQAKAFKYLVASAVAGMQPEDVSIIDANAGLIATADENPASSSTDDRAADLKRNVERLLEARVGHGNAVVEVSVETLTESESITERRIDPDSRIAISIDTQEKTSSSEDQDPANVTVASNLPAGDAAGGGQSSSNNSETRERSNYEVSETRREVVRQPGALKRLTVAVLVNGISTTAADGTTTWAPRPAEELDALRSLVSSAVGLDESRGDVITLQSMEFEPTAVAGTEVTSGGFGTPLDIMQLIQIGVAAVVALVLGLGVMKPILTQRGAEAAGLPAPEPRQAASSNALTGEIAEDDGMDGDMPLVGGFGADDDMGFPMAMGNAFDDSAAADADPVDRLKRMIEERRGETVEILRSWMDEKEERA
ncbi:flagellar M-ring protein FliF [Thioclava sp. SK-1]|uniref:flagellar basal-body MS-ring/collar protein FliF n=1 Tax=Thioclava sp. SK-1 TaxID=1889770 RepID=UPI0008246485|nr:flagellar basal-body MS-ring/collar protein FliF [Thioclava sp. SK-1]OCX65739.1 flagellar M-ring protein FliF [Thioclava sp. SK-1]